MILERLSVDGIDTSPYYEPNGKFNTTPPGNDIQMPNCTMYCYLRTFECSNATKPFPVARTSLGFGNAKTWYGASPLEKGSKLKQFSIACFDGTYGHVAFVEQVIDSTHALITESQYDSNKSLRNYKYWQKRVVELIPGKATLSGVGVLQGFLYVPVKDIRVSRNSEFEQVEILDDMVNVRVKPNGNITRAGNYAPRGIYNILDIKNDGDWDWYQLDKNCWVRQGDWTRYYPIDSELEKLRKENRL